MRWERESEREREKERKVGEKECHSGTRATTFRKFRVGCFVFVLYVKCENESALLPRYSIFDQQERKTHRNRKSTSDQDQWVLTSEGTGDEVSKLEHRMRLSRLTRSVSSSLEQLTRTKEKTVYLIILPPSVLSSFDHMHRFGWIRSRRVSPRRISRRWRWRQKRVPWIFFTSLAI